MDRPTSDLAFTPAVKAAQARRGSRAAYARMEAKGGFRSRITPELAAFAAARDSFYLATANARGRPYIQHRGGPKGFLRALDEKTFAFADFAGNRQYITVGTLEENDQAFIFLMDYAKRRRVKLWGRARYVEGDAALMARLIDPGYAARPERAVLFTLEAWDANCSQHITPRFTEAEIADEIARLEAHVARLEAELARLRGDRSA